MSTQDIKSAINTLANLLKDDPSALDQQIALIKKSFPSASEEKLRKIVENVSNPNFNPNSIANDLSDIIKN